MAGVIEEEEGERGRREKMRGIGERGEEKNAETQIKVEILYPNEEVAVRK